MVFFWVAVWVFEFRSFGVRLAKQPVEEVDGAAIVAVYLVFGGGGVCCSESYVLRLDVCVSHSTVLGVI